MTSTRRLLPFILLPLAACAPRPSLQTACQQIAAQPTVSAQLLFGLSRKGGQTVSPSQWQEFLTRHITPRFPAGLTVFDGAGQWSGADGVLAREPSKLVLVVTDPTPDALAKLQSIRNEYKSAFAQDSVGLVLTGGCASF